MFEKAKELLTTAGIYFKRNNADLLNTMEDKKCDNSFLLNLYRSIFIDNPIDVVTRLEDNTRFDVEIEEERQVHNCQCIVDALSLDILHISLSHIDPIEVVRGNKVSRENILQVFLWTLDFLESVNDSTGFSIAVDCANTSQSKHGSGISAQHYYDTWIRNNDIYRILLEHKMHNSARMNRNSVKRNTSSCDINLVGQGEHARESPATPSPNLPTTPTNISTGAAATYVLTPVHDERNVSVPSDGNCPPHQPNTTGKQRHLPISSSADTTPTSPYQQHTIPTSACQQHTTPTSAYQQHATPTSAYQQHATPTSAYQQHATPTSAYQQHATPTSAYHQHTIPTSAYQQHTTPTPAYQQHTTPTSAYQQHTTPTPAYQQHTTPTSAYQQHTTPTSAYQQHTTPTSAYQQHTTPTSAYKQHTTPTSPTYERYHRAMFTGQAESRDDAVSDKFAEYSACSNSNLCARHADEAGLMTGSSSSSRPVPSIPHRIAQGGQHCASSIHEFIKECNSRCDDVRSQYDRSTKKHVPRSRDKRPVDDVVSRRSLPQYDEFYPTPADEEARLVGCEMKLEHARQKQEKLVNMLKKDLEHIERLRLLREDYDCEVALTRLIDNKRRQDASAVRHSLYIDREGKEVKRPHARHGRVIADLQNFYKQKLLDTKLSTDALRSMILNKEEQ